MSPGLESRVFCHTDGISLSCVFGANADFYLKKTASASRIESQNKGVSHGIKEYRSLREPFAA